MVPCGPRALINMEGSAFETWRGRDGFRPTARHIFPARPFPVSSFRKRPYPASVIVSACASRILCLDRACSRFFRSVVPRHERCRACALHARVQRACAAPLATLLRAPCTVHSRSFFRLSFFSPFLHDLSKTHGKRMIVICRKYNSGRILEEVADCRTISSNLSRSFWFRTLLVEKQERVSV